VDIFASSVVNRRSSVVSLQLLNFSTSLQSAGGGTLGAIPGWSGIGVHD